MVKGRFSRKFIVFTILLVILTLWPTNAVITRISADYSTENKSETADPGPSIFPKTQDVALTSNIQLPETSDTEDIPETFTIKIPKISLYQEVEPNVDPTNRDIYLPIIEKKVAHGKGTSLPDDPDGNTYLFAHSRATTAEKGGWFTRIDELTEGDLIILYYNGTLYEYSVVNYFVISPKQTSVYTGDSLFEETNSVTLQTCYPRGSTESRLIIQAKGI